MKVKKQNPEKYLIVPINGGNPIEVYSVDAKEAVASGSYKYVNIAPPGQAEWLPSDKPGVIEVPVILEEKVTLEGITKKEVLSMNTSELEALLEDKDFNIEGFSSMNLKDKRASIIELIEE